MALQFRVHAILAEDQSSFPSTHIRWLPVTTPVTPAPDASSLHRHQHSGTSIYIPVHVHIIKGKIFKNNNLIFLKYGCILDKISVLYFLYHVLFLYSVRSFYPIACFPYCF